MKYPFLLLMLTCSCHCIGQLVGDGADEDIIEEMVLGCQALGMKNFSINQKSYWGSKPKARYKEVFHFSLVNDSILHVREGRFETRFVFRDSLFVFLPEEQSSSAQLPYKYEYSQSIIGDTTFWSCDYSHDDHPETNYQSLTWETMIQDTNLTYRTTKYHDSTYAYHKWFKYRSGKDTVVSKLFESKKSPVKEPDFILRWYEKKVITYSEDSVVKQEARLFWANNEGVSRNYENYYAQDIRTTYYNENGLMVRATLINYEYEKGVWEENSFEEYTIAGEANMKNFRKIESKLPGKIDH